MSIVDDLKALGSRIGVTATGNTIQEVIRSINSGLDAREAEASNKHTFVKNARFPKGNKVEGTSKN